MDRWKVLLSLRESALTEIEKARATGLVKAPREAKVNIRIKENDLQAFFKGYEKQLPIILGVSQTEIIQDSTVNSIRVEIQRASGIKCARCWIYKMDVGVDNRWPDVCRRCADALSNFQEGHGGTGSDIPGTPPLTPLGAPAMKQGE